MSDTPEFRVSTGDRPPTVNRLIRMHWSAQKRLLDEWRDATWAGILGGGWQSTKFDRAEIRYWPVYPKGTLPDGDGLALVTKAIADTIVAAGIIPDDNPFHCSHASHNPRRNVGAPCPLIVCEIVPVEPVEGHGGDCGCRAAWEASQLQSRLGAGKGRQ